MNAPVLRQNSGRLWNQQHSCFRLHHYSAITCRHVSFPWTLLRNAGSPLLLASRSPSREFGTSATACRAQAASSALKATFVRPPLLAARSPMLVRLETSTPRRHAGNRCPMALRGIPLVLEDDFEAQQAHR